MQTGFWIAGEFFRLARTVVGIENKTVLIEMLQQHDALAGLSIRGHGGNSHGAWIPNLEIDRLLHPLGELIKRIICEVFTVQTTVKIFTSQGLQIHHEFSTLFEGFILCV